jgi:uncharacterized protein YndB with AHSA1/START domain
MTQKTSARPYEETRSLVIEREMPHAAEKIWRALTKDYLIEEWLMKNDFQAVVGHRFNLRTTPMPQWSGVIDCEVLIVEPYTQLSYSWNSSVDDATEEFRTVVTWTLTPTETGTRVRMEQSGFRPDEERNYKGANYGWQRYLAALEKIVGEKG